MKALRPEELAEWRARGRSLRLLDVREAAEWTHAHLEGAEWRPLSEAHLWLPELADAPGEAPIVVYCHHGMRSARVCGLLEQLGVLEVWNLSGGLEAWSLKVDPSVPRY